MLIKYSSFYAMASLFQSPRHYSVTWIIPSAVTNQVTLGKRCVGIPTGQKGLNKVHWKSIAAFVRNFNKKFQEKKIIIFIFYQVQERQQILLWIIKLCLIKLRIFYISTINHSEEWPKKMTRNRKIKHK